MQWWLFRYRQWVYSRNNRPEITVSPKSSGKLHRVCRPKKCFYSKLLTTNLKLKCLEENSNNSVIQYRQVYLSQKYFIYINICLTLLRPPVETRKVETLAEPSWTRSIFHLMQFRLCESVSLPLSSLRVKSLSFQIYSQTKDSNQRTVQFNAGGVFSRTSCFCWFTFFLFALHWADFCVHRKRKSSNVPSGYYDHFKLDASQAIFQQG